MNSEIKREIEALKEDIKRNDNVLEIERERIAEQLKGSMGKDIRDVMDGKIVVKLSFKERLRNFLLRIFNTI